MTEFLGFWTLSVVLHIYIGRTYDRHGGENQAAYMVLVGKPKGER
jgi:hypothetical protein